MNLNYHQVAFLLGQSETRAISTILKALNLEPPFSMMNPDDIEQYKKNFYTTVEVGQLTQSCGIDCEKLVNDINSNFTKNKACMDYLMKEMKQKIKPQKSGLLPLKANLPEAITSLMTPETRAKVIGYLKENLSNKVEYLTVN